jgi:alpha-galactosidase
MPNGSFTTDFIYKSYEIKNTPISCDSITNIHSQKGETLIITLVDEANNCEMKLYYGILDDSDMIIRKTEIINHNENRLYIRKLMSLMLDFKDSDYNLISFGGGWGNEMKMTKRELQYGTFTISSTTGNSSNRNNPGFILSRKDTNEESGVCFSINLIYSGNHYEGIDVSNHGLTRIMNGINPYAFKWDLSKDESFETPLSIISYSSHGLNLLSKRNHDFINKNVVSEIKERFIAINTWEAFDMNFNFHKLKKLLKTSKKLGIELFVLDDGWFSKRNDDKSSLGDYNVNKKKLPFGLKPLSSLLHKNNMKFGLWFEPEMINPNSDLYSLHSEYAVKIPNSPNCLSRNQLVLDLCNMEVVNYIIDNVVNVINTNGVDYIKWDMNRHISDAYSYSLSNQGRFYHTYMKNLYYIFKEIKAKCSNLIIETCASGGNRFDLGMLTVSSLIWASDCSDPIERLRIQKGYSYLYPLSVLSCHVSETPNFTSLRRSQLFTRFNVACFGCLGYELDLNHLNTTEKKEIISQIKFYKENKKLFQFGEFRRIESFYNYEFEVSYENRIVRGVFKTIYSALPPFKTITYNNIDVNDNYYLKTRSQTINVSLFGILLKYALPKILKKHYDSALVRFFTKYIGLKDGDMEYNVSGNQLYQGFPINQEYGGAGLFEGCFISGDFYSKLFILDKISNI